MLYYALMLWVIMFWGYMVCLTTYVLADGIAIIYFFYFILFIQLYPDGMGNYGLRLWGVFITSYVVADGIANLFILF